MGRYCNSADISTRYRKALTDINSAIHVDTSHIFFAENELDAKLGKSFTVPFSSNNATAKDLAIDLTYARILRFANPELHKAIMDDVNVTIGDLIVGKSPMLTTSGDTLYSGASESLAWSNTMSYSPSFGMDDESWLGVTSAQLEAEYQARY